MISGRTRLAAVIGSPVAHTLSPALHNAAFSALGLDWVYVAFEVAAGNAARALDAFDALGLAGLSVTMPHKDDVAAALTARGRLDPAAAALRSVNTVSRDADGVLLGHSTDGAGFVASLRAAGVDVAGRRVCLLGAGAAARAIADALARAGVGPVTVRNRTPASAREVVELVVAAGGTAEAVSVEDDDALIDADIVINATSIGMGAVVATGDDPPPALLPCKSSSLRAHHVVADIVYHPLDTPLLRAARAVGALAVDGLGMLVHQAALQQRLWHGATPDVSTMLEAATRELAARGEESRGRPVRRQ